MRLKNWEKPRDKKRKRNSKGKNASARLRQLKKRDQLLRKILKEGGQGETRPLFYNYESTNLFVC